MGGCEGVGVDPPSLLPSQQLPVHAEASRECSCTSSASSTSARSNSRWTEAKQQPSQLNNINNNTTPSATDEVTFNNSVMFVRLQPEQPLGTTKAGMTFAKHLKINLQARIFVALKSNMIYMK